MSVNIENTHLMIQLETFLKCCLVLITKQLKDFPAGDTNCQH